MLHSILKLCILASLRLTHSQVCIGLPMLDLLLALRPGRRIIVLRLRLTLPTAPCTRPDIERLAWASEVDQEPRPPLGARDARGVLQIVSAICAGPWHTT